ncbi:MAG TPA: serine hydrolase [Candidatus Saccharimonadia bacterium]|nr:serine hydrolase [Candidatus Saccharimonadia bacterium]
MKSEIDAAIDDAILRYHLPGIAVGVVENGEVVHVRTAGVLVAGEAAPVTRRTLFKVASNTKSMTTTLLARLVDRGALRWDDPVVKHLPRFRMHDPWVTREMQVRDLLIHNSGLPAGAGDLMLWPEPNAYTRADVLRGLAHLKPAHSFRSRYAYDNLLYIVAGEVAAAAGGVPYDALLRREVFEPLRMSRCQVGGWNRDAVGDVAQPHMRVGDRNVAIRRDAAAVASTTMEAAGGVRCSVDDMLAWMRYWLAAGSPSQAGTPFLSADQRAALWTPHTPMPVSQRMRDWNGTHFYAYGYGWRLQDIDGEFSVSHTGTLAGMYSIVHLLPERRAGFVILMNGEADEARTVLNQVLVKRWTGDGSAPAHDVARYAAAIAGEAESRESARVPGTSARKPAAPASMAATLGTYHDPWFGEATICARGDSVHFAAHKSPSLEGVVMRVGDRLLVDWTDPTVDTEAWLEFTAATSDAPGTLRMAKVDPDADFSADYEDLSFTRLRGCDSGARTHAEAGLVDVASHVPGIELDIRYAGRDNFLGVPVDGYDAPRCYLKAPVAAALAKVERDLRSQGLRLRVFDCYRPVRAVRHFVAWAQDLDDQRTKPGFYPNLDKQALMPDYISPSSGHSRGATLDLTLLRCARSGRDCEPLDMGTPFDFFDPSANTDSGAVTGAQRANRRLLRDAMERHGFRNYPLEWWHYTWQPEPAPDTAYDVPVR